MDPKIKSAYSWNVIPRHVQALLGHPVMIPSSGQHQFVYRSMYVQAPPGQEVPSMVTASPSNDSAMSFNIKFIKTLPGILKICELISLFTAWICALKYKGLFDLLHVELNQRLRFFLGSSIATCLLVVLVLLVLLNGYNLRCCGNTTSVLIGVIYALFSITLAMSSGLLTEHIIYKWEASYPLLEVTKRGTEYMERLYAAVVFGFLSSVLLAIDAVLFCAQSDSAKFWQRPTVV